MDFKDYDQALKFMQKENAVLNDYKHLKNYAKTMIINSWRINYQSWRHNNFFRRFTIKYEDMVKKPNQVFRDLIVYVNTICRFNVEVDEKKLNNAIKSTNFKKLQEIENQGKFSENVYSLHDNRKIKFFYQGPQNDWQKNLDDNMIKKMNKYYEKDLIKFGYDI